MSASHSGPGAHVGLFKAASIGLIVFAAIHTLAVLKSWLGKPESDQEAELMRHLLAARQSMGPFSFTFWGLVQILSASYSSLLFQIGIVNLIAMRPAAAHGALGRLAWVNAFFSATLAAVSLAMQFPPPLVCSLVVTLLFVAAAMQRPREPKPVAMAG